MSASIPSSLVAVLNPWPLVAELWRRRELAWQFTVREVQMRHRGSRLGFLWTLINPLSMLALYFFVFGEILGSRFAKPVGGGRMDFALALFLGLCLFRVFAEALAWAPSLIVANPNFVKKVVFPLEVLPFAKICDSALHLLVGLGLVLIGSAFTSTGLSWNLLWLPVLLLPLLLLAFGIALGLAAIGVFLRDIGQLTAFFSTLIMFASAVPFPVDRIKEAKATWLWDILKFNPLLQIVDQARHVVLWHEPLSLKWLGYAYACAIVVLLAGNTIFRLLRRSFAEVI